MGQVAAKRKQGITVEIFGRHVHRAARIQALAKPGHILTSFSVYDCAVGWLKSEEIKWQALGKTHLKGIPEGSQIHEPYRGDEDFVPQTRFIGDEDLPLTRTVPLSSPLKQHWAMRKLFRKPRSLRQTRIQAPAPYTFTPHKQSFEPDSELLGRETDLMHATRRFQSTLSRRMGAFWGRTSGSPRVLWVDDYPENNLWHRGILSLAGWRVDTATTTEEATTRLKDRPYELVISDMGRGENATAGLDIVQFCGQMRKPVPAIVFASRVLTLFHGRLG
jgi:CheY-like chemotaxis protein